MSAAKIRLSQKEIELINNGDWILTKNALLKKTNQLLGSLLEVQQQYLELFSSKLPAEVYLSAPKISKGENYKGLPYLMLDYPRLFDKKNILAIRTMFWWGNFFSVTLHLSGVFKERAEQKIVASWDTLKKNEFYCCVNEDQWEHHFETNNYKPLSAIDSSDFENLVRDNTFIKLANKIPLQQWDNAEESLFNFFKEITRLLVD